MANKKQTNKRRVSAARQEDRRQAAADKQLRRRQLIVGGVVGFLALALIAPLTAGLIGGSIDEPDPTTSTTVPTTTVSVPWLEDERAGASIDGPTPCPPTDGSAERTTAFATPPPTCIEPGATFDLRFETDAGSFSVPVDSALDLDAANLAVVFGRYGTYEQTPLVPITGGLLSIGSVGDTGFTIPATPPTATGADLYPVGSVVAVADTDSSLAGSLVVVVEESGSALLALTPRHVVIGTVDDLAEIEGVFDEADVELDPESDEGTPLPRIESVTVTETG